MNCPYCKNDLHYVFDNIFECYNHQVNLILNFSTKEEVESIKFVFSKPNKEFYVYIDLLSNNTDVECFSINCKSKIIKLPYIVNFNFDNVEPKLQTIVNFS